MTPLMRRQVTMIRSRSNLHNYLRSTAMAPASDYLRDLLSALASPSSNLRSRPGTAPVGFPPGRQEARVRRVPTSFRWAESECLAWDSSGESSFVSAAAACFRVARARDRIATRNEESDSGLIQHRSAGHSGFRARVQRLKDCAPARAQPRRLLQACARPIVISPREPDDCAHSPTR
jgi:hypothetical protein